MRSRCRGSAELSAHRDGAKSAAWAGWAARQAGWWLLGVLISMVRLQSDAEGLDCGPPVRGETSRRGGTNVQLPPLVLLEPLTCEQASRVPLYIGPMRMLSPQGTARTASEMGSTCTAASVETGRGSVGPMRARKTKRMDRRLSHWRCVFCRHETPNDANVSKCGKCGGARSELGDADTSGREQARRAARSKDAHGRQLNALGVGTARVPRAAQGVFESSRRELLVREETQELELYTGAPSYLVKEDCMIAETLHRPVLTHHSRATLSQFGNSRTTTLNRGEGLARAPSHGVGRGFEVSPGPVTRPREVPDGGEGVQPQQEACPERHTSAGP